MFFRKKSQLLQSQEVEARDWFIQGFEESKVDQRGAINEMFDTVIRPNAHVDTDVLLYVCAFPQTRTIVIGREETYANVIVYEPLGEIVHTIILGHQGRHFTALELVDGDVQNFLSILQRTPEVVRRVCAPPQELFHDWIAREKRVAECRFGTRVVAAEVVVMEVEAPSVAVDVAEDETPVVTINENVHVLIVIFVVLCFHTVFISGL